MESILNLFSQTRFLVQTAQAIKGFYKFLVENITDETKTLKEQIDNNILIEQKKNLKELIEFYLIDKMLVHAMILGFEVKDNLYAFAPSV